MKRREALFDLAPAPAPHFSLLQSANLLSYAGPWTASGTTSLFKMQGLGMEAGMCRRQEGPAFLQKLPGYF